MTKRQAWKLFVMLLFNQASWASAVYLANRYAAKVHEEYHALLETNRDLYEINSLIIRALEDADVADVLRNNPALVSYMYDKEFKRIINEDRKD